MPQLLRLHLRSPLTTALAVLAIGLGVGANTALFSAVRAVLLRPLPYAEPERLVTVWEATRAKGVTRQRLAPARVRDWQQARDVFAEFAAYDTFDVNLTGLGAPDRVRMTRVTTNFFALTGTVAVRGRLLVAADERPGAASVAVVSHRLWQSRLASGAIDGRTLRVDDRPYDVVGVLPAEFALPDGSDVYVPLVAMWPSRVSRHLYAIGRLAAGVDLATARARVDEIAARLDAAYPASDAGLTSHVTPLAEDVVGAVGPALRLLMGAVGLVLLIACADVASLLLVRAAARRRELAIRLALGATRARLAGRLVAESLVLAAAGGLAGLVLASWLVPALASLGFARFDGIRIDAAVLVFTAAASVAAGLLAGLAPALAAARRDLAPALGAARGAPADEARRRAGLAFVVLEIALATTLAIGATLLGVSLRNLARVDPGFRPQGLVTARVTFPRSRYPGSTAWRAFEQALVERVSALPGVVSAAVVNRLPLGGAGEPFNVRLGDRPADTHAALLNAEMRVVSPSYFRTMGIPLLEGRLVDERDAPGRPLVAVINRTMARRFWPDRDAIGRRFTLVGPDGPWIAVVGIVGDVRHDGLDADPRPEMYVPFAQETWPALTLVARTDGDSRGLTTAIVGVVRALDPELPVYEVRPMTDLLDAALARPRFESLLVGGFAGLALALALAGVFGVLSYAVSQRTPEIGVRLALGAEPRGILRLVLADGLRAVMAGVALGAAGAWGLGRLLSGALFGVGPANPAVFALTATVVMATGLVACWVPARRAARVDPAVALRAE